MKLSIIVPVYKVEPYLRRCVDSILAQTLTDFELILVDDGSPDGCPAICDEYAQLDSRVCVIHKPNGGLSDARNAGLDVAQGEYIGFVDSDDYIHPQVYKLLIQAIEKSNADIGAVDLAWVYDDKGAVGTTYDQTVFDRMVVLQKHDYLDRFYPENRYFLRPEVCSKVYGRHIFNDLRFPLGQIYEDAYLQLSILQKANKVVKLPVIGYYYRQHENSIMHSEFRFKWVTDMTLVCQKNLQYYKKQNNWGQVQYALEDYLNYFCRDKFAIYFRYPEYRKEFREYEKLFSRELLRIMIAPRICKMKKVMLICTYIYPRMGLLICRRIFNECVHMFMRT